MYKQVLGESQIVNRIKKAKTSTPETYPKEIKGYNQALIDAGETVFIRVRYGISFIEKPMITWYSESDVTVCDVSIHVKTAGVNESIFVIRNKMDTSLELRLNYCIYGEVRLTPTESVTKSEATPPAAESAHPQSTL